MVIWRYDETGTLDPTFDTDGVVARDNGGGTRDDEGFAVAVDSSNRVIVTGHASPTAGWEMAVWANLESGAADATFGTGGFVSYLIGNSDSGRGIALDGSERILVASGPYNGTDSDMAIYRLDTDGSLDTTFNPPQGWRLYDGGLGSEDRGSDVVVDASGRILVAGYTGANIIAVWRYLADGTPDFSFGTGGLFSHDIPGTTYDRPEAMTLQAGRILLAGWTLSGSNYDMLLVRCLGGGALDSTFGAGGIVTFDNLAGGGEDVGEDVAVDAQGRILMVGRGSTPAFDDDMILLRVDLGGTLDPAFGSGDHRRAGEDLRHRLQRQCRGGE
jgi:uncharacterized delta-60 repeat protein